MTTWKFFLTLETIDEVDLVSSNFFHKIRYSDDGEKIVYSFLFKICRPIRPIATTNGRISLFKPMPARIRPEATL